MAEEGPAARPGAPRPPGRDAASAMRRHRERHAFLARRRGAALPAPAAAAPEVKPEEAEAEEVVICKLERAVEAAEGTPAAAGGGRKRRRREGNGAAEAGPSGWGAGAGGPRNAGLGTSRFRGVRKDKRKKAKPWRAYIQFTENGKGRVIHIGYFAREEDAARAFDRANIAAKGHTKAKTNFPVAQYREEWAELEALGVDGAVALMREHAAAERPDVMDKASRFRGVYKSKKRKTNPWTAQIHVTEDGKRRLIHIANFAREEDAARAYDHASIAKLGHAKAKMNFPVAEYRAELGQLEAMGVEWTVARERRRQRQE